MALLIAKLMLTGTDTHVNVSLNRPRIVFCADLIQVQPPGDGAAGGGGVCASVHVAARDVRLVLRLYMGMQLVLVCFAHAYPIPRYPRVQAIVQFLTTLPSPPKPAAATDADTNPPVVIAVAVTDADVSVPDHAATLSVRLWPRLSCVHRAPSFSWVSVCRCISITV